MVEEKMLFFFILGQVWCLIASIPDLCPLSYFVNLLIVFLPSMCVFVYVLLTLPLGATKLVCDK